MTEINSLISRITQTLAKAGFVLPKLDAAPAAPLPVVEAGVPVDEPVLFMAGRAVGKSVMSTDLGPAVEALQPEPGVMQIPVKDGIPQIILLPPTQETVAMNTDGIAKATLDPVPSALALPADKDGVPAAATEQIPGAFGLGVVTLPAIASGKPEDLRPIITGGPQLSDPPQFFAASVVERPVDPAAIAKDMPTLVRCTLVVAVDLLGYIRQGLKAQLNVDQLAEDITKKAVALNKEDAALLLVVLARSEETPADIYDGIRDAAREFMLSQAIALKNQDAFAHMLKSRAPFTRDEARAIFKAAREYLVKHELWPAEVGGKLAMQAETLTDARVDRKDNPEKGVALKQLKTDNAANAMGSMLQIARRIARDLAKNGPVCIDDVTLAMARDLKVAPGEGETAHNWKGKVFAGGEWVSVGQVPSRIPEAHSRPVQLWALKSWLAVNTLNGSASSAYNLAKIFSDFKRAHPGLSLSACNWYVGDEQLSTDARTSIVSAGMKLYEIPVAFIPGAVGAVLMAPDYAKRVPVPAAQAAMTPSK